MTQIELPTDDDPSRLAGRASRAFGWSLVNTIVSRLGTLAIGIALARLLGPTQFGTFAVATVALLAILSFNELGVSLAIVRWRTNPAVIAPTVNTISVASSLVLFVLVVLTAPTFSAAMGDPGATNVVRLMAVAVVINGAVATPAALLQRNFRQGRRLVLDQVNTWLGAFVSLILAFAGFGAMSLAVGRIAGATVSGVLFLVWSPLPYRFGLNRAHLRGLLRFGLPLAGASIIVFAVGYADQLTTGRMLGATALGFYVLAFNLASWPVSIFSQPLRSVAPALFARLQDEPERMNAAFGRILRLLMSVALPCCLVIAGAAEPIITLVYGSAWLPAVAVLSLLALGAGARIFFELSYDFLVILGRSRSLLLVQCAWLVLLLPTLYLGARWDGLRGVAIAQSGLALLVITPIYLRLLIGCGLRLSDLATRIAPAGAVALSVGGLSLFVSHQVASPLLACMISGVTGLLAAVALCWPQRNLLRQLRRDRSAAHGEEVSS